MEISWFDYILATLLIQVVTSANEFNQLKELSERGFQTTIIEAISGDGWFGMLLIINKRKVIYEIRAMINKFNTNAVYSFENVRIVNDSRYITESGQKLWI